MMEAPKLYLTLLPLHSLPLADLLEISDVTSAYVDFDK